MSDNPLIEQIDNNPPKPQPQINSDITLSDEQKLIVLKRWELDSQNPPPISELVHLAWPELPDEQLDGRLKWGKAIKQFLVNRNIQPLTNKELLQKNRTFELTDEQKDYITNNCSNMKPIEMAKALFNNQNISPASNEVKLVIAFIRGIDAKILFENDIPESDYRPPKTTDQVLKRIKKYVSETEKWDRESLTTTQRKCCDMVIHYLHDHRFKRQIDSYEKSEDKLTFESEFVKYVYNKSDLVQEEISQYVSLCSFVVMEFSITSYLETLKSQLNEERNSETGKISSNLVDAIESARADLDACSKRQSALYNSLIEKRSEKVKGRLKDGANILNVIELWKNEESRKKMITIANLQKEKVRDEINRLESMEDIITVIAGLDKSEVLNG